jgi:hypothetical protein
VFPLALAASLLFLSGCASGTRTTAWVAESTVPRRGASLAVAPFENLAPTRNAGLVLTDLASTVLYAQGDFRVVEPSSLSPGKELKFRQLEVTPWEHQVGINLANALALGKALKVDWVLVGSVDDYGFIDGFGETASVGLTLRLVRVSGGEVCWAGSLSRRAPVPAFSQASTERLAHELVRDLLEQMRQDLVAQRAGPAKLR